MSLLWHFLGAILRWLYAHLASLGISAVVTTLGGVIMWFLGFRKRNLEIEHLKAATKRIELEVQRLTDEKRQRDESRKLADLCERIIVFAKESIQKTHLSGATALREDSLCAELGETPQAVSQAMRTLADRKIARHSPGGGGTWIFDL